MAEYKMLSEIKEQPEVIRRLIENRQSLPMQEAVAAIKDAFSKQADICLVGNGSSYNSCIYGEFILSIQAKMLVNLYDTSEFDSFIPNLTEESVVILVSQSGETGDAIKLIPKIKFQKSKIILISNNPDSTLAKEADIVLDLKAGVNEAIPSTKGYIAEITTFALVSDAVSGSDSFLQRSGVIINDIDMTLKRDYHQLLELADRIHTSTDMFVLGHSVGLSNAYEAALKFKECSHIETEGYSGLEFRHGPSSVITADTPVIVLMADYQSEEDLQQILSEVKDAGAYVIGIGPENLIHFDYHIEVVEDHWYSPMTSIVPVQILAFELALVQGINPDAPEGVRQVVK